MFMNCKKSSPINGHVELQWGRTTTPCNTTVLRHCLTLIPSALRTGTTPPLHGVGGTQWHVTTCNTKNCGSITHIQQHLTTNCTTSGMRAVFFSTSTVPAFTTIKVVTFTTGHFQPK